MYVDGPVNDHRSKMKIGKKGVIQCTGAFL